MPWELYPYLIALLKYKFNQNRKKYLITFLIFYLLVSSLILIPRNLKIYFVDVGQGDSTFIVTPKNQTILIDGGGNRNPEQYDIGEKVMVPYLLDRRVKKSDYIIVSHFDADHAQGLEAVIRTINVKNIVISKQASRCSEYEKIMDLCKERKIKVIVIKRGEKYVYNKTEK